MDLKKIYKNSIEEYNKTPLATEDKWILEFSKYTFFQFEKINEILKNKSDILDIGTGSGILPICLKKLGHNVTTIDHNVTGGNSLKNINIFDIESKNVDLNSGVLPFNDNSFNVIYMGDVIEHLPNSPKKIIAECSRLLKPNGRMIVSTPNSLRLIGRLKLLLGNSTWPKIETFYYDEYNGTHHHEYTPNELKFVFTDNKFMIEKIHFFEQNLIVDKRLNSLIGKIIKNILKIILNFAPELRSNIILIVKN
jgi:2-polyprenyl-3-methyl-5-hydroxy-6-metoxy-1,4-benzoquinol methylase